MTVPVPVPVPAYVDIDRLCSELCISEQDVARLIEEGELPPPIRLGYLRRWKWQDVELRRSGIGDIYFLKCGEFVKIGFTISLETRIAGLKSMIPYDIELLCSIKGRPESEERLHQKFAQYRHRGEWFRLEGDLLASIQSIQGESR